MSQQDAASYISGSRLQQEGMRESGRIRWFSCFCSASAAEGHRTSEPRLPELPGDLRASPPGGLAGASVCILVPMEWDLGKWSSAPVCKIV